MPSPRYAAFFVLVLAAPLRVADDPPKPDDVKKGVYVTRIAEKEIGRETVEIRDDGWTTKGDYDVFGRQKCSFELTCSRADDRTVFHHVGTENGEPIEFTGTLDAAGYSVSAKVGGEDKTASVDLTGKPAPIPFMNLVAAFYLEMGRELTARAKAEELEPGTTVDLIGLAGGSLIPLRVNDFSVAQAPWGKDVVSIYSFSVTLAGQVDGTLGTSANGIPVYFGVPGQSLETFLEGYETLKPAGTLPHTIVDSGSWRAKLSKPEHTTVTERNVKVPMRDGVELAADLFRPEKPGKYATILVRTPYGRDAEGLVKGSFYSRRGYAVVAQDVRGRGESEGTFRPFFDEAADGSDTLDWIAAQPWSDGSVGMIGGSYVALVQWHAASTGNPHLKAIVPQVSPPDPHENIPYEGGVFSLGSAWWAVAAEAIAKGSSPFASKVDFQTAFATLPLVDLDKALGLDPSTFLDDWISHPPEDPYWEPLRYQTRFASIDVPALNVSGWFDGDQPGAPINFVGMRRSGKSERARKGQLLVMGPWTHLFNSSSRIGEFDFGKDAIVDLDSLALRFFDRWLKGIENGIDQEDPVLVFTMFENKWHREKDWPLPQTAWTKVYLGGSGKANTWDGGGTLALDPADSPPDRYAYDPADVERDDDIDYNDPSGAAVSRNLFDEPDEISTLDYTSPPLETAVEITGPVSIVLHVTTDAKDTDFAAGLTRTDTGGKMRRVAGGIQRLRYRDGWNKPSFATPGEASTVTIDCWAVGLRLEKGERLGVHVTSNAFPGYVRNPNTGEPDATAKELVVANQTVFHDIARPSHVLLPVIPREGQPGLRFAKTSEH